MDLTSCVQLPNCVDNCVKKLTCDGKNPEDHKGCADKANYCAKWKSWCTYGSMAGTCPVTCEQCDPNKKYEGCTDMLKMCEGKKTWCSTPWFKDMCRRHAVLTCEDCH